ncbi:MAG: MFS transporter [Candidatus Lokiarchaeota archaeon]
MVFFIGLGVFNMITTNIDNIANQRGFGSIFSGILGLLLIVGGIIGTLIMSILSDKLNKRKVLIIISLFITTISLFLFSFSYLSYLLLIFGFTFGFGLLGAAPIALEYAADATRPVPEGTSNGILMMLGQIGGIILILLPYLTLTNVDYLPFLIFEAVLLLVCLVLSFILKEIKIRQN